MNLNRRRFTEGFLRDSWEDIKKLETYQHLYIRILIAERIEKELYNNSYQYDIRQWHWLLWLRNYLR